MFFWCVIGQAWLDETQGQEEGPVVLLLQPLDGPAGVDVVRELPLVVALRSEVPEPVHVVGAVHLDRLIQVDPLAGPRADHLEVALRQLGGVVDLARGESLVTVFGEMPRHAGMLAREGRRLDQAGVKELSERKGMILVSGRYEGIDERVIETFADEVYSIGDYILTGGELPSLVMADAISRNVEGVLGNQVSLEEESFEGFLLEAPAFARPPEYENIKAPSEYMNGNHAKITALKLTLSECKTKYFRPNELLKHKRRKKYEK